MLINTVIIVLREVLEASLILSVFLAYCQRVGLSRQWLGLALILGTLGAGLYAAQTITISTWFDGVGQEVVNAGLQLMIYSVMALFISFAIKDRVSLNHSGLLLLLMVSGVALATIREGNEIILYILGFTAVPDLFPSILLGAIIGAGIGISVGIAIYYLLVNLSDKVAMRLGFVLAVLIAAAMVSQSVQQLIQADWIMSQYPLWDTSSIIDERSVAGQLFYALFGYEATPTPIQASAYLFSIILIVALSLYNHKSR